MFLTRRPEVSPINYVTRVKIPTLMLNGKFDIRPEKTIQPMYDLLGTPAPDKQLKLYETDTPHREMKSSKKLQPGSIVTWARSGESKSAVAWLAQ